ncbi:MAG: hypothetical protein HYY16_19615 [Planctomycetes bacterium]|nr:hypothetical protein [Planctomycetota bacterium]
MSTDLFVYVSDGTPITHTALHGALRQARWHLLVVQGAKEVPPSDAPLRRGAIYDVYGAADPGVLAKVRATLGKPSEKSLERLYKSAGLNSVYLKVDEVEDPSEIGADDDLAEEAEAAKLSYYVNGHAGKLQYALWKALGALTGGLMGDPQEGTVTRGAKKTAKARKRTGR